MVPFVIAGVGALVGGGFMYFFSESDKNRMRESMVNADEALQESERRVKHASDREARQRYEQLRRTIEWTKDRQSALLQNTSAPLTQLERIHSVGLALEEIITRLPEDGVLAPEDKVFVDVIIKASSKQPLTAVDRAHVEDYLDSNVGAKRKEFLILMLSSSYRRDSARKRQFEEERDDKEIELFKIRQRVRLGQDLIAHQERVAARIARIDERLAELADRLQDVETALVVIARISRPDFEQDRDDAAAYEIVTYLAREESLTMQERRFMDAYKMKYFVSAKNILKREHGIDIVTQEAA